MRPDLSDNTSAPADITADRITGDNIARGNITGFARLALALTAWTERWIPDAFIFAILGTLVVVVAGATATPSTLPQVVDAWGRGFWELIPFTLQMSLVIITGHVLATSPPMRRVIRATYLGKPAGDVSSLENPEKRPWPAIARNQATIKPAAR